jgi:Zn-dependent peptidase ImmA (M78 family)
MALVGDRVEQRERIRRLRLVRRWDQPELGRQAGYSPATISQIETGRLSPTDAQVERLAGALGYSPSYLVADMGLGPTSRPWLRAYADASKKEADIRRAACTTAVEHIRLLGLRPLQDRLPIFMGDPDSEADLEEAAQETRLAADVEPDAVVGNAIRAAERLGCVVLPFETELGRHLGMSVRSDNIPVICVANDTRVPGDRQRFTVAHEVAHLVLHSASAPPTDSAQASRLEHQANLFAAAFLTPADPLIETLHEQGGRVTLATLLRLKAIWGVAIKSLVGRFKTLGIIDADHARSLYKQISARGWNTHEPGVVRLERAQWLSRVLDLRSGANNVDAAATALAQSIGANPTDLRAFASWQTQPDAEVVTLSGRRTSARRSPQLRPYKPHS